MAKQFIYSDIDSQMTITNEGNVKIVYDLEVINQSIKTILSTIPGERIMNPMFGSSLYSLLFDPMTPETTEDIQYEINNAISRWEDRVVVDNVEVQPNYDNNYYDIRIHVTVVKTQSKASIPLKLNNLGG